MDGSFPYRFREEDLWNHLTRINFDYKLPLKNELPRYKKWVKKKGKAQNYLKKTEDAAIHPDIQLQRSADYLEAIIALGINNSGPKLGAKSNK